MLIGGCCYWQNWFFGRREKLKGEEVESEMSVVYRDANENKYPVKVNGFRISSKEELWVRLDFDGITPNDTLRVRIRNDCAEIEKGDPVVDAEDITYACMDGKGNIELSGFGG